MKVANYDNTSIWESILKFYEIQWNYGILSAIKPVRLNAYFIPSKIQSFIVFARIYTTAAITLTFHISFV